MANTKISQLPSATTPVVGTEVLPIVQSSTTSKVSIANLTAGRAVSASSYDATGATAPANGMFSSSSNNLSFSTASGQVANFISSSSGGSLNIDDAGSTGYNGQRYIEARNKSTGTSAYAWVGANAQNVSLKVSAYSPSFTVTALANKAVLSGSDSVGASSGTVIADFSTGTNQIQFYVGTVGSPTLAATISSLGNLGLGVAPSTTTYKTFELGTAGSGLFSNGISSTVLTQNAYFDTTIKYANSSYGAGYYQINGGVHTWATAAAGTAGNTIAFGTAKMTLSVAGDLTLTNNPILSGGTINGVAYLNGSRVLTTGTGLVFDGSKLGIGVSPRQSLSIGSYLDIYSGGVNTLTAQSIRAGTTGNLILNAYGSGYTYINFDSGTGGLVVGNGTGGTDLFTLNSSGNLGLGVTPSSWGSGHKALQLESFAALDGSGGATYLSNNWYSNAGNKYIGTGQATLYAQSVGVHSWYTSPSGTAGNAITFTQAMTLDASGNLGVGTTSPSVRLQVYNNINGTPFAWGNAARTGYLYQDSDGVGITNASGTGFDEGVYLNTGSSYVGIYTQSTERARIDSSGNLLVGTTSAIISSRRLQVEGTSAAVFKSSGVSSTEVIDVWNPSTGGNNAFIEFQTETSITTRGSITYNRGAGLVAYNVTSDYRAKNIIGPVTDSGTLIDSVPVYMGKMKGATQERPMFIAHEVPTYAHTGEKDAVDADGNPVYQQMDTSALVPVMWAEIQSLRQRLAAAGI